MRMVFQAVCREIVSGCHYNDPMSEATSPEVKRYQRQKLVARILSVLLGITYTALLAFWVGPRLDVGGSRWLQLLVIMLILGGGMELLTLPLDFWSTYVLEHRYHLSNQTLWGWIKKHLLGGLVGGLIGVPVLFGFYALLWFTDPWWLWATLGWLVLTLVLGRLAPVLILPLFYKVTRLDDADLLERLRRIAAGTGLTLQGIYRLHLSAETRKANAALTGLGRSRRVLLGDTLLEQFTPEEIEVVFAHEVGHHVHRHLPKLVLLSVVLSTVGFWLVDVTLRALAQPLGYAAFNDPAALPLVLLVLTVFGLIWAPVQNALSRYFERQCDRYALQRTGLREAYRSAFTKLARVNKADLDPHPLLVWLFHDHPAIRERIAMADEPLAA
jgi:STE24 endopeptidase